MIFFIRLEQFRMSNSAFSISSPFSLFGVRQSQHRSQGSWRRQWLPGGPSAGSRPSANLDGAESGAVGRGVFHRIGRDGDWS